MDGLSDCTGCKRFEEEMKNLSAKVESNEQNFLARVENMEQTFLKATKELQTRLKHSFIYGCYESSSSNSDDIGGEQRKRKTSRLMRLPRSGYRYKKLVGLSSRRKGKKPVMKTDDNACAILNDGKECKIFASDKWWFLAEAIREHSVPLVSQLPFDESELCDMLIPDCLTEDENQSIRKLPNRRSKIRSLLCLLAGRDYDVLKKFLTHAKRFDEPLVEAVWKTFEEKVNMANVYPPICILCSIKNNVEVSYVIDHLYSRNVISKKLLQKIACGSLADESLWDELYEMCLNHRDKGVAFAFLAEALEAKGHYKHLSEKLMKSEPIYQMCMCPKLPSDRLDVPLGNSFAPDSSDSPYTSLSIASTGSFGEDTSNEDTMDPTVSTTTHEKLQQATINSQNYISKGKYWVTLDKESTKRSDTKQEEFISVSKTIQSSDESNITVTELSHTTLDNHTDAVHEICRNAQMTLVGENPERECLRKDVAVQGSFSCDQKCSGEHYSEFSVHASKGNHDKNKVMSISICTEVANGATCATNLKTRSVSAEFTSRPDVKMKSLSRSIGSVHELRLQKSDDTNARRSEISGLSPVLPSLCLCSDASFHDGRTKRVKIDGENNLNYLRSNGQHKTERGAMNRRKEHVGRKSAPGSLENLDLIPNGNVTKSDKNIDSEDARSSSSKSKSKSKNITWKQNTQSTIPKDGHLEEVIKCKEDINSRSRKTMEQETSHKLIDEATQTLPDQSSQDAIFFTNNFNVCLQFVIAFILATLLFIF